MNNGFYETVSVGSLVAKDLLNYALSTTPESWVKYYNFDAVPVHPNLLLQDSFLSYLAKKRDFEDATQHLLQLARRYRPKSWSEHVAGR